MQTLGAHACTDITGFGFIGHALEMAAASRVGLVIRSNRIPFLPRALEYAAMGLIPGGAHSNRQFFSCKVESDRTVSPLLMDLLYDPQTSGGLLVSLPPVEAEKMVEALRRDGHADAVIVGEIVGDLPGKMKIF
jgi:selenide,water dikinase